MVRGAPGIELLWWQGCPSWERVLAELRVLAAELGLDPGTIQVTEVSTDLDAEREQFVGSPTVRVNGHDVQPPGADEPLGLTCRVYRLRDGRISPTPDLDDLREALSKAASERS